jgi:large subunit ribosomal protein L24
MGTASKPHNVRIRRGDMVRVIAGDDRGRDGRVLRILEDERKVVVEGVNLVHRHVRRSQKNPRGGRIRREAAIHISNVMVLDSERKVPTRVGRRQEDPAKKARGWVRYGRRSGRPVGEETPKKARRREKDKE